MEPGRGTRGPYPGATSSRARVARCAAAGIPESVAAHPCRGLPGARPAERHGPADGCRPPADLGSGPDGPVRHGDVTVEPCRARVPAERGRRRSSPGQTPLEPGSEGLWGRGVEGSGAQGAGALRVVRRPGRVRWPGRGADHGRTRAVGASRSSVAGSRCRGRLVPAAGPASAHPGPVSVRCRSRSGSSRCRGPRVRRRASGARCPCPVSGPRPVPGSGVRCPALLCRAGRAAGPTEPSGLPGGRARAGGATRTPAGGERATPK